jgi:hypothetical protein
VLLARRDTLGSRRLAGEALFVAQYIRMAMVIHHLLNPYQQTRGYINEKILDQSGPTEVGMEV